MMREIEERKLEAAEEQEEWWQELREVRESGESTDEWPKQCPFTGQEIDEDGADSCPDACKHHDSAEFRND